MFNTIATVPLVLFPLVASRCNAWGQSAWGWLCHTGHTGDELPEWESGEQCDDEAVSWEANLLNVRFRADREQAPMPAGPSPGRGGGVRERSQRVTKFGEILLAS